MSIKLTPLEDKIIVKQAEAETQTASGLFIPDNAKEKPQQGEVLAVGPGRRDDKWTINGRTLEEYFPSKLLQRGMYRPDAV